MSHKLTPRDNIMEPYEKPSKTQIMKKALFILSVAVLTIVCMSACRIEKAYDSNEPAKTYNLNLARFTSLHNASNCDVHFVQSDTYKVTLKASQSWYDHHSIGVEDGALVVKNKKHENRKGVTVLYINTYSGQAEMWVSAPSLDNVSLAGSGDFSIDSDLSGKSLSIVRIGSGDTKTKGLNLAEGFSYTVSGSGDADMGTVKAHKAEFTIVGSGDVKSGLEGVASTALNISGSGDAELNFCNCGDANVEVTGSGDVSLSGQLKNLSKRVSGSGEVETSKLRLGQ